MKKLIFILVLCFIYSLSFGQIYTNTGSDVSITILPIGITGKIPDTRSSNNVALGRGALNNITDTEVENTAIGNLALGNTTKSRNTAFGNFALYTNNTGEGNTAFGNNSLLFNTSGDLNTAFGNNALYNNLVLGNNVAIGVMSLYKQGLNNNLNVNNTAVGYYALYENDGTGKYNTGIGAYALQNNVSGEKNLAIGVLAASYSESGNNNVVVGNYASTTAAAGSDNVAIGSKALADVASQNHNIGIGYDAGAYSSNNSMIYIANDNTAAPLLGGISDMKKVGINRNLNLSGVNTFLTRTEVFQVEGEAFKTAPGGNWVLPSDRRLKKNITPLNSEEILAKVLQMKGVTYEMKDNTQKGVQYGFTAQELREVFPAKIKENADGYLSADYGSYTAIEIEAIKALHDKISVLEKYNNTLRERIEKLKAAKELISQNIDEIESKK